MIWWHHLVFLWGSKTLNSSWYSQCRHMWKMVCRHVSHGILHQTQRFVADLSFLLVSWGYLKMAVQPPARSPCHQGNCWLKSGSSLECRLHTYNTEPGTAMKWFLSFADGNTVLDNQLCWNPIKIGWPSLTSCESWRSYDHFMKFTVFINQTKRCRKGNYPITPKKQCVYLHHFTALFGVMTAVFQRHVRFGDVVQE